MRFLVFNLVVFLSIGYLFTAAPGQSVGSWLDNTISSFSEETTTTAKTESDKKPDVLLSTKPKSADHFDPVAPKVQASSQRSSGKGVNQITVEKIQKTINDAINTNIGQIVKSLHLAGRQSADSIKPDPVVKMTTSTEAKQMKPVKPVPIKTKDSGSKALKNDEPPKKPLQQKIEKSDKALAQAFRELYPTDTNVKTIVDTNLLTSENQPALKFMTPSDRQTALSELIQNLQMTYVTQVGN